MFAPFTIWGYQPNLQINLKPLLSADNNTRSYVQKLIDLSALNEHLNFECDIWWKDVRVPVSCSNYDLMSIQPVGMILILDFLREGYMCYVYSLPVQILNTTNGNYSVNHSVTHGVWSQFPINFSIWALFLSSFHEQRPKRSEKHFFDLQILPSVHYE